MKKPIIKKDGSMLCPLCKEELYGDGENHLECSGCEYFINEADLD